MSAVTDETSDDADFVEDAESNVNDDCADVEAEDDSTTAVVCGPSLHVDIVPRNPHCKHNDTTMQEHVKYAVIAAYDNEQSFCVKSAMTS